jgi:hypothetical protein
LAGAPCAKAEPPIASPIINTAKPLRIIILISMKGHSNARFLAPW